jgi:hypothetical protein
LLYRNSDGQLADTAPGTVHPVTATIDKTGGGWKVTAIAIFTPPSPSAGRATQANTC